MRHRRAAWLLVVPAGLLALVALTSPYPFFHQHLNLAGSPGRFAATVVRAGRADARAALWLDNVFAASWLLIVPAALRSGLRRWAPERRRLVPLWRAAPGVAAAAGVADLIGNGLGLYAVGLADPPTGVLLALTTLTWMTWLFYGVSTAALLALVVGPLSAPRLRPVVRRLAGRPAAGASGAPPPPATADGVPREAALVLCLGDDQAAAAAAVGVLRGAEAVAPRWIAASGAAATAVAARAVGADPELLAAGTPDRPLARAGAGAVAVRALWVAVIVLAAVHLAAAAAGAAIRTRAIHPWFPYTDRTTEQILELRDLVPLRLVLPVLAMLAIAALVVVLERRRPAVAAPTPVGLVVAGAGLALLLVLLVVPMVVRFGRWVLVGLPSAQRADEAAAGLAAFSVLVLVGSWALARASAVPRRLGTGAGIAAATALLVLFGGKVADTFARDVDNAWRSWPLPGTDAELPVVAVAAAVLVAAWIVPVRGVRLFEPRRAALRRHLLAGRDRSWAELAGDRPEPIVALAAGADGWFVVRPAGVTLRTSAADPGASVAMADYPRGSWWDGFAEDWTLARTAAAAADPSGDWVPDPRVAHWFADRLTSPRLHGGVPLRRVLARLVGWPSAPPAFLRVRADDGAPEATSAVGIIEVLRDRPAFVYSVGRATAAGVAAALEPALAAAGLHVQVDSRLPTGDGGVLLNLVLGHPHEPGVAAPTTVVVHGTLGEPSPSAAEGLMERMVGATPGRTP